jgi:hypothetical protein
MYKILGINTIHYDPLLYTVGRGLKEFFRRSEICACARLQVNIIQYLHCSIDIIIKYVMSTLSKYTALLVFADMGPHIKAQTR